jgi:hypothetical protein
MKFFRNYKFLLNNRKWVIYTRNQQIKYYRRRGRITGALLLAFVTFSITVWSIAARHTNDHGKQPATDRQANWKSFVTNFKPLNLSDTISRVKDNKASNQGTDAAMEHKDIITTVFWVGESADSSNAYISNTASAWDDKWQAHYGGVDNPDRRQGYFPAAFTPKENPFYVALPYNDLNGLGNRKPTANGCPNSQNTDMAQYSWCKNAWVAISHNGTTVSAQWEDVGPLHEADLTYVFGKSAPKNTWGMKAGLDVSPAVRDYLGLKDVDKIDWRFISSNEVPSGPWKQVVTTSKGYSVKS